jgi:hypothetical protein
MRTLKVLQLDILCIIAGDGVCESGCDLLPGLGSTIRLEDEEEKRAGGWEAIVRRRGEDGGKNDGWSFIFNINIYFHTPFPQVGRTNDVTRVPFYQIRSSNYHIWRYCGYKWKSL